MGSFEFLTISSRRRGPSSFHLSLAALRATPCESSEPTSVLSLSISYGIIFVGETIWTWQLFYCGICWTICCYTCCFITCWDCYWEVRLSSWQLVDCIRPGDILLPNPVFLPVFWLFLVGTPQKSNSLKKWISSLGSTNSGNTSLSLRR